MIEQIMAEGPNSLGGVTIWLGDYHAEYSLPTPDEITKFSHPNGKFSVGIKIIWDSFSVAQLVEASLPKSNKRNYQAIAKQSDDILKALTDHFPKEIDERGRQGHIWEINGSLKQHIQVFRLFVKDLAQGCTGSDDDFFDYWPNAMDMAYDYAQDLNKLTKSRTYTNLLKRAYVTVVKRRPDVCNEGDPSWHYPDKRLMKQLWRKYD